MPSPRSSEPALRTLAWFRAELDYDIASEAWILYDSHQELEPHLRHQIADLTAGENRHRVSRLLGEAFAEVARAIGKRASVRCLRDDDTLKNPRAYRLRARIDDHCVMPLVERVHAFLVARVLGRALLNLLPKEAARITSEADARLDALQTTLPSTFGSSTARRPLSPF